MPAVTVPIAAWKPDAGEYSPPSDGMLCIENLAPSPTGYDRQYHFAPNTTVNPAQDVRTGAGMINKPVKCVAYTYHSASSTTRVTEVREFIFTGAAQQLFVGYNGAANFDDVSRAVGGPYTAVVPEDGGDWVFSRMGNFVLAANGVDPLQIFDMSAYTGAGTADFANITAPAGAVQVRPRFVCAHKTNLFAANVYFNALWDGNNGVVNDILMWSDDYSPQDFGSADATPSLLGTGWIYIRDDHGGITGLASTAETLYVFKEDAIYRVDGPVYNHAKIVSGIGTKFWNTIFTVGNVVYFWSQFGPAKLTGNEIEVLGDTGWSRLITGHDNHVPTATQYQYPRINYVESINTVLWNVPCGAFDARTENLLFGFNSKVRRMKDSVTGGVEETTVVQRNGLSSAPHALYDSICDTLLMVNAKSGLASIAYPMNMFRAVTDDTKDVYGFRGLSVRHKTGGVLTMFRKGASYTLAADYNEFQVGSMASNCFTLNTLSEKIEHFGMTINNKMVITFPFIPAPGNDTNRTWKIDAVKPVFVSPDNKRFTIGTTGALYAIAAVKVYSRHGQSSNTNQETDIPKTSDSITKDGRITVRDDRFAKYKCIELTLHKTGKFTSATLATDFVPWPGKLAAIEVEYTLGQKRGLN